MTHDLELIILINLFSIITIFNLIGVKRLILSYFHLKSWHRGTVKQQITTKNSALWSFPNITDVQPLFLHKGFFFISIKTKQKQDQHISSRVFKFNI